MEQVLVSRSRRLDDRIRTRDRIGHGTGDSEFGTRRIIDEASVSSPGAVT